MDMVTIELPIANLWLEGVQKNGNLFHAQIVQVNQQIDQYAFNNHAMSSFNSPIVLPGKFTLEIRSNNVPSDNVVKIIDENEQVIDERSLDKANTVFNFDYQLVGCYKLVIEDRGGDGLSWWANTAQGTGYAKIKNANGTAIRTLQSDFGNSIELAFTTDWVLNVEDNQYTQFFSLYPNPATASFTVEGKQIEGAQLALINMLGQTVFDVAALSSNKNVFTTNDLDAGIYIVKLKKGGSVVQQKIHIQH
jgi:hypothetical protein